MGEAKRRKQNEPNFGRVPQSAAMRGLVVSPPIEITGTTLFAKSSNLDRQELRFALLFWDKLVWPSSRVIHFSSNSDEAFLESAGVLTRPDYTMDGESVQGIARGQIETYRDLERKEPGMWALAPGENSLLLKDGFADEKSGMLLELHRAIPIPRHDVPLAEILEFRYRRRDELSLLRYQLESFVSEIEGSADKQVVLKKCIAEIDQACADLLRVSKEPKYPVYLSNIKVSFSVSLGKLLLAGQGWTFGEPYGLVAATTAAGLVGVGSMLELKGDIGRRSAERPASPYRYTYQIHQELC